MELLERDGALAALAEAREAAARGSGRVVFVTGEPGIGKSSLVARFLEQQDGTRVLVGTCDDLSIPRPLGPIRDLVGSVSRPLEEALSAATLARESLEQRSSTLDLQNERLTREVDQDAPRMEREPNRDGISVGRISRRARHP